MKPLTKLVHRGINGIPVTSTLRQAQGTSELVTYFRFHVLGLLLTLLIGVTLMGHAPNSLEAQNSTHRLSVTVVTKDSSHPATGQGSNFGYAIDGIQGKEITLERGQRYDFELTDVPKNNPFYISTDAAGDGEGEYTQGVIDSMAVGDETLTFTPSADTPNLLYYQSGNQAHMGWRINVVDSGQVSPLNTVKINQFVAYLEGQLQAYKIPGGSVTVVQGDQIMVTKGLGRRRADSQAVATEQTIFHIGSTNKAMTGFMIGTLVDKGVVTFDDPVGQMQNINNPTQLAVIRETFTMKGVDAAGTISLRHILGMASGIPADGKGNIQAATTVPDLFKRLAEESPLGQPGQVYKYSNPATSVGGYIAAMAAGTSDSGQLYQAYVQLMKEHLLTPSGMSQASLGVVPLSDPNRAGTHQISLLNEPMVIESADFEGDPLAPSGIIKATASDLAKFIYMQVNAGKAPNGRQVIQAATLQETKKAIPPGEGQSSYGMGWGIDEDNGIKRLSHNGSFDNNMSQLVIYPEAKVSMFLQINMDGGDYLDDAELRLGELLYGDTLYQPERDDLADNRDQAEADRQTALKNYAQTVNPAEVQDYLGRYTGDIEGQAITVTVTLENNNQLWGTFDSFNTEVKKVQQPSQLLQDKTKAATTYIINVGSLIKGNRVTFQNNSLVYNDDDGSITLTKQGNQTPEATPTPSPTDQPDKTATPTATPISESNSYLPTVVR